MLLSTNDATVTFADRIVLLCRQLLLCYAGVDVATDPRAPRIKHVVEASEIQQKTGLAFLHSSHCLGSGASISFTV